MTRPEILDTAKKCVCGDREQDYGTPEKNFGTIAALWTAYKGIELTAVDVAAMLALVKLGRIASGHGKADNWIDLAGYAACGGEIESAQGKPTTEQSSSVKLTQEIREEMFADVEPAKGKYEGLSIQKLLDLICERFDDEECSKCPLEATGSSPAKCSDSYLEQHPEEFRKIAIEYLEGLEKQN